MQRQFSPLLAVRERECRQIVAQSKDSKGRERRRNELQCYLFYRGKVASPPSCVAIDGPTRYAQ